MAVPYTFGSATTSIPLSQLDSNFATGITLGNTSIQLGNTVTTLNNMTMANVTVSSGNVNASILTSGTVPSARQPTGSVLQVVQATTNSNYSTASSSFTATGFTLTITPISASNKILIMINGGNFYNTTAGGEAWTAMYRSIGGGGYSQLPAPFNQILDIAGAYSATLRVSHSVMLLDSPATTSAIIYQPYMACNGTGTAYFNNSSPVVTLTAMEISA